MGMKKYVSSSLALIALVASGCGPAVGDECQAGQSACLDGTTELSCQNGVMIATPCRGAAGCTAQNNIVSCDISGNQTGDACSTDDTERGACSADRQTMVMCQAGAYKSLPCRGANHCQQQGPYRAVCDVSIANVNDECEGDEAACSADGQSMLSCVNGRMTAGSLCRGANHCQVQGRRINCDASVSAVGDTCTADSGASCSADGLNLMHCVDGHIAVQSPCRGPQHCRISGNSIDCDSSLAQVGDPCEGSNAACREDGLALLECQGGAYAQTRECAACSVAFNRVTCN